MKCYMCDGEATTSEHVPPKAFFPKGYRENLVTVPSCFDHNHDQSLDIEYTRNVIASFYGRSTEAEQAFEVARRSFDRSVGLFHQTFGEFETIVVDGQETGVFPFDLPRLKSVMKAIANAIYFREYGHRYTAEWKIFATSLKSHEDLDGQVSQWEPFRKLLQSIQFVQKPEPQPKIFTYGVHQMTDGFVFKFVFYEAFAVHCWGPRSN